MDTTAQSGIIREPFHERVNHAKTHEGSRTISLSNCWFRRNLSLTGLYYQFSNYGESIARPTIIVLCVIVLSSGIVKSPLV